MDRVTAIHSIFLAFVCSHFHHFAACLAQYQTGCFFTGGSAAPFGASLLGPLAAFTPNRRPRRCGWQLW